MDFIQMTQEADSVTFSINWEVLTAFAESLTTAQWWLIALGISVVYGIITHSRSLVQISRWNKRADARHKERVSDRVRQTREMMEKRLEDWELVPITFYRLFFNLPVRIAFLALGVLGILLLFGCSGKVRTNPLFRWGWGWTLRPHRLRLIMTEGPPGIVDDNWNNEDYA